MAVEDAAAARTRLVVVVLILIALSAVILAGPAIPQDPGYHRMADTRCMLGIPNLLNVVSNVPFAVVGAAGLIVVFRRQCAPPQRRGPFAAVFAGTALTALGSAYYHLAPDNTRLVWDRLPMSLVCAGLLTVMVAECGDAAAARRLFVPLLALAPSTVLYWQWSETHGAGDLRPYAIVQYGTLVAIVLLLALFGRRIEGAVHFAGAVLAYGFAKVLELADGPIFAITGHAVSGHTLKHLTAAIGLAFIAALIRGRSRIAAAAQPRA
jgi:hypothetical protein